MKNNEMVTEIILENGSDSIMVIYMDVKTGATRHDYLYTMPGFASDPEYLVYLMKKAHGLCW